MPAHPKYQWWYDLGASKYRGWAAANSVSPPEGDAQYLCPLCPEGRFFTKADVLGNRLTAEDVPPKSVGGRRRKIVLTCYECNNDRGGSTIDFHAERHENWEDSMSGRRIWPFPGVHTVGGYSVNVEAYPGPGQLGIARIAAQNDANQLQGYKQALHDPANTTQHLHIEGGFTREKAYLSYLRAAYLASFAVYGWTQILRDTFVPLRQWIADGECPTDLPAIVKYDPGQEVREVKILLVTQPGPQQGLLLFKIARTLVALPGPSDERTLDEVETAVAAIPAGGLDGEELPWPTRPRHLLDPDPDPDPPS